MKKRSDNNQLLYPWAVVAPVMALPVLLAVVPFSWQLLIGSALAFFLFDSLGVQIVVHKCLAHRSFSMGPVLRNVLATLAVFSGQGSPLVWVAVHIGGHHPHSDTDADPHTPLKGRWYAALAWYWRMNTAKINFRPAREYMADPWLCALHRHHSLLIVAYWGVLLVGIGPSGWVYLGVLPAAVSILLVGLVNSYLHRPQGQLTSVGWRYQNHVGDTTYNSLLLGPLTMGLGFHNNHHHDPSNPFNGERWYELDPSRWLIPLLRR